VSILRRFAACVTIAFTAASSAGLFVPGGPAHECTDHVCACPRKAAPELPKSAACHESTGADAAVSLQASCDHHREAAAGGAGTLLQAALLPPVAAAVAEASERVAPPPAPRPRALAPVPEAPPPRSTSC
jgi:hypothetical protein